jgi:hypothetical protein
MMMGKKAEDGDQIEIEDIEVLEDEDRQTENVGDEDNSITDQDDEANTDEDTGDGDDEVVVSIGEDAPPPEETTRAPEWVRELRKADREKARRIKELEAKLNAAAATETKPVALGAKPKLEDHDYDTEKFEAALADWYERKRATDQQVEQQRQAEKAQHDAWQARLESYGKARAELKVRDFEDAEATAQEVLDVTQQGIVVQGADNPALVIYALGKNPKKAKEIAGIKDPVKFAFAVAKLEKELKVTNRKAAPPPERVVSGTGRVSGAVDSTRERRREEAARTGNMTKVLQYKRQKQAASKN